MELHAPTLFLAGCPGGGRSCESDGGDTSLLACPSGFGCAGVALIEARHCPTMIVDHKSRILASNAAANLILKDKQSWTVGPGRALRTHNPAATADLHASIRLAATSPELGTDKLVRSVPAKDGTPSLVMLSRLRLQDPDQDGAGTWLVMVSINRKGWQSAEPEQQVLVDAFGFTPAEARLTLALLEGQTPQSYARAVGVKISTVRWHLSNALDKAGCANQRDLFRLMVWLMAT